MMPILEINSQINKSASAEKGYFQNGNRLLRKAKSNSIMVNENLPQKRGRYRWDSYIDFSTRILYLTQIDILQGISRFASKILIS